MVLKDFLLERKSAILSKWFEIILDTYPAETARFLRNQKDLFSNPVGSTIFQGIDGLLDEIIRGDIEFQRVVLLLDNIIRVRAIQDFSASQAVAFIFSIKDIIRHEVETKYSSNHALPNDILTDLGQLDSNIDRLALMSFDIYMQCREKIYEIKANEVKNMTYRLLQQARLIVESPEEEINK